MNDDSFIESAGAYVLDALSTSEAADFERHLAGCAACQAEVRELREVVGVLPLAVDPVEPPDRLKGKILTAIRDERPEKPALVALPGGRPAPRERVSFRDRVRRGPVVLGLVAAAAIAALVGWNVNLQQQVNRNSTSEAAVVTRAVASGAQVMQVASTPVAPGAHAAMVQPRRGNAYFVVTGLRTAPAGKVYQLWLVRRGVPVSAAVFNAGGSTQIIPLSTSIKGYALTAVTVEPGPHGSRGPTGPRVLSAGLA